MRAASTAVDQEPSPYHSPVRFSLPGSPLRQPLLLPIEQIEQPSMLTLVVDSLRQTAHKGWSGRRELYLVWQLLQASYFSVLLVFVPLGLLAGFLQWSPLLVFGFNLVSLIPLALILGDVTEDLAEHYGDVVGGLLNATFGNVGCSCPSSAYVSVCNEFSLHI